MLLFTLIIIILLDTLILYSFINTSLMCLHQIFIPAFSPQRDS